MIATAKKNKEIQRPLAKKINKAIIAKVRKVTSAINISNKYK